MTKQIGFGILMALAMVSASADLNDDFVYSSKFGLLTETVTTSWTTQDNGLAYGGNLNGVPRDSWHDLYYYNGQLSFVQMGYVLEPLVFETEKAYRRWMIEATNLLVKKAKKKYGPPYANTLECPSSEPFESCEGLIVWRGTNKVFQIGADNIALDSFREIYYGLKNVVSVTYGYAAARDYDLMAVRLPTLAREHNQRNLRILRRDLLEILGPALRRKGLTLDEYFDGRFNARSEINKILRKSSLNYIGGVKANYSPERWVRSFRLQ